MQIKNSPLLVAVLAGAQLSLFALPAAQAVFGDMEEPTVSYILHHFSDVDGVNVMSQYSTFGVLMPHDVSFSLQWGHDIVVFPAIEAAPGSQEAVDAITTSSRPIAGNADPFEDFVKIRDEVQGTVTYGNYNASYYVSTESDYFAQMVSLGYSHEFLNENLNISTGTSYSWDSIEPLDDADTPGTEDFRRTLHVNAVATQVLTPTTVFRVGGEFNKVRGLQHDSYRNVYVAGTNVPELHPKNRDRWDVFLSMSQYIANRSSLRFDYRYYTDDWGLSSQTLGGKLSQYITDEVIVRYRYRYYTQSPASFFRDDYTVPGGVNGFQTGDYRLGDYGAHLFGGQVVWYPHRILGSVGFLEHARVVFSYEHYFNSNNFSANIFETGLQITF